jgi:hypothetical protein
VEASLSQIYSDAHLNTAALQAAIPATIGFRNARTGDAPVTMALAIKPTLPSKGF